MTAGSSQEQEPQSPDFIPSNVLAGLQDDAREAVIVAALEDDVRRGSSRAAGRFRRFWSPTSDPHMGLAIFVMFAAPALWLVTFPTSPVAMFIAAVMCSVALLDFVSGLVLLLARNPDQVKGTVRAMFADEDTSNGSRPK